MGEIGKGKNTKKNNERTFQQLKSLVTKSYSSNQQLKLKKRTLQEKNEEVQSFWAQTSDPDSFEDLVWSV